MFENIIGYKNLTSHWQNIVSNKITPPAILVVAPSFTGKCTFALELARGILCEKNQKWTCVCKECRYMRLLENENIILLGRRDFLREIFCAKQMILNNTSIEVYVFFYCAVMKILRRAYNFLWHEIKKWKDIKPVAESLRVELELCRELCVDFSQKDDSNEQKKIKKTLSNKNISSIIKYSEKLQESFPSYITPVHLLRNMATWSKVRGHGNAKIILLENTQDLHESSSAMLLKILEEPPEDTFFILTAYQSSSVLPTILSRVRQVHFPQRTHNEEKQVLEKVFKNYDEDTVRSYITRNEGVDKTKTQGDVYNPSQNTVQGLEKYAKQFLLYSKNNNVFKDVYLEFLKVKSFKKGSVRRETLLFLEYLQSVIHDMLKEAHTSPYVVQKLFSMCTTAMKKINLNLAPQLVLESLYYKMVREIRWYKYE